MLNMKSGHSKTGPGGASGGPACPVVWLLGKTGAGKSSLVCALTGESAAEIGNGFKPCTRSARSYDFPPEQPLVRFLDTRGLGESGYRPEDDLEACRNRSHVLLVLCRLDDPVQGMVAGALADILRHDRKMPAILVLTGRDLVVDPGALERAERTIAAGMNRAAGRDLPAAVLSLAPGRAADGEGLDVLRQLLLDALPAAGLVLEKTRAGDAEQLEFQKHKRFILSCAGVAFTSDVAPVVGMVAVPATQLKMLHDLGRRYGVKWDRKIGSAFLGTMGLGIGARFAANFGLRELAKLVPVYGQTAGAAAAGAISFATTYALGRAAAYFLYRTANGSPPGEEELRQVYRRAFDRSSNEAG
ncbi:YcjF family protein [Mangrovicoccus sp. HB161399]|uniref:YcjF family protein n=1 Tax=Mangrovicoccus sp. HB161399 TaxID=2720392 RepID=UPI0015567A88|nr:GTPase [Mangrovicoccus sp. HB161399]